MSQEQTLVEVALMQFNHPLIATIRWIETEDGGRAKIPEGSRYSAPVCADGHSEFPDCSWSLNIETTSGRNFTRNDTVTARFRVEQAPHEWLTPGTAFWMYEGRRKVLEGVIESG